MYSWHTKEYDASMNQMLYLKVLPLCGEVLLHCENQADLLVYWYMQCSDLTSTEAQENYEFVYDAFPIPLPNVFLLIDFSDSLHCE